MTLIVDSHLDLAYNAIEFNRELFIERASRDPDDDIEVV